MFLPATLVSYRCLGMILILLLWRIVSLCLSELRGILWMMPLSLVIGTSGIALLLCSGHFHGCRLGYAFDFDYNGIYFIITGIKNIFIGILRLCRVIYPYVDWENRLGSFFSHKYKII